jgi:hypothetical protein
MPQNQPFDVPRELRQLAEENVERARQLYLQFIEGIAQTMTVWATPASTSISPGFNRLRARAVKFAKENADAAFSYPRRREAKELGQFARLTSVCIMSRIQHRLAPELNPT